MDRKYVYNKSDNIALGNKITVPEGAICVRIVSGYFSNGEPTEERYAEWLEPVRE